MKALRSFSKKKFYDVSDVSVMTERERDDAVFSLEKQRSEINAELERMMLKYSRLTGKRAFKKRKHKFGEAPNDYRPERKAAASDDS